MNTLIETSALSLMVPKRIRNKPLGRVVLMAFFMALSACATENSRSVTPLVYFPYKSITAVGYGTVEKSDRYSRSQIKLMAMRASKMDAYRSLAEQLHGIQINSQTTVDNMQINQDKYQIFLNTYLRGAKVKRTTAIGSDIYAGDDTFETVVELDLTPRFYECMSGSAELITQCIQQSRVESSSEEVGDAVNLSSAAPGCNFVGCFNYPLTSGFKRP